MGMTRTGIVVAALVMGGPVSASAQVVEFGATADASLFEEGGDLANGGGDYLFCGITNNNDRRRALMSFDIAASVPAGATIESVTLTLSMSRTRTQQLDVSLHPVTQSWGEGTAHASGEEGTGTTAGTGDATWTHRFYDTTTWSAAGGDFSATASATTTVANNGSYMWTGPLLVADVQQWLDNPASNFGWAILCEAGGKKDTKRFDTRENADAGVRPLLAVTFSVGGQTGACCDADGSCTVVSHPGGSCTGTYQGGGSACVPNPCPQPPGACCTPDETAACVQSTESACSGSGGSFLGVGVSCTPNECPVVLTPYVDPMPRAAVAQPTTGAPGGAATYRLEMVEVSQRLHRDLPPSRVWGFSDGVTAGYPGPTLETRAGSPVTVTWANNLRDIGGQLRTDHMLTVDTCAHGANDQTPRTVVHLHGGHVPAAVDGYPESTFLPGQEVDYTYPNDQQAATLWYHDHALGITRLNVYMGLAGFYLVRDAVEDAIDLPTGTYEVPMVIQDRRFRADGSLFYPAAWQEHFFGDTVLVNGKVWPWLAVDRGKYRFRVISGSGSRTYRLSLSDGATFYQIGTDGGLLPAPVPLTELTLGPGERADLIIDFESYAPGTEILLVNDAPAPFPGTPGVGVIPDVMKFVVGNGAGHTSPLPSTLRAVPPLDQSGALARDFVLEKATDPCTGKVWLINGLGWDDITERPNLGTTEIWRFINDSGMMHPMHMHLVFFQVLDRQPFAMQGGVPVATGPAVPPPAHEAGWKDTVQVAPGEMVRVIARFDDYVGKFAYHCHILEHEDHEMMRQFETVTTCGDGARGIPGEECDDGNTIDGDGCSSSCTIEAPIDAGVPDAGVPDAGVPDAGPPDAGTPDAGTGMIDAGVVVDAGPVVDASLADAGSPPDDGSAIDADVVLPDADVVSPDATSTGPDAAGPDAGLEEPSSGGCCDSGGTPDGGLPVLVVLLLLLYARWGRRRRAS